MEDEKFLSGYCRQLDRSRTVTVELTDGQIDSIDCGYTNCVHRPNCPIARQIENIEK